ncbi:solute carrier family 25 member 36 isoform X2 [Lepeophtheirus salmonis]|nr:mitochondrial carrier protein Rim2-like isoform X3 [Lepeophtheirus salmonis]
MVSGEEWRTVIHLVSGGTGGTLGAILTCPFEVVKTRLQSSQSSCPGPYVLSSNPWACLKDIVKCEGLSGLFKGLGPNLLGVAPARAMYFCAYSWTKDRVNVCLPVRNRDTPFVHVLSAASAGFTASTLTNPIWLIKTRLQLDRNAGNSYGRIRKCVAQIYHKHGLVGFWKGVTASYWGISETAIHFVIYEYLKTKCLSRQTHSRTDNKKSLADFAGFMVCGACSKTFATVVAYPHDYNVVVIITYYTRNLIKTVGTDLIPEICTNPLTVL